MQAQPELRPLDSVEEETTFKQKVAKLVTALTVDWDHSFLRTTFGSVKTAVLASSAAVVFGLAILTISIFAVANPMRVHPQEPTGVVEGVKQAGIVEYYLPYPGILPDSPLYKLKAARDRVNLWLSFDEETKAEKELLFADKRINAAIALVEGGKKELGVSTATKAEKYLDSSVNRTVELSKEGKDVKSHLLTLGKATAKHVEILEDLMSQTDGDLLKVLENALKTTKMNQEKVGQALAENN